MNNKSKQICIILIVSLVAISLSLSYKIPFFDYAMAQKPSTPELTTKVPALIGNLSSSSVPNNTSSNQSLIKGLTNVAPSLAETLPSHEQPSYTVKNKISVQANNSGRIGAFCDDGDGLVIGGYSLNSSDGGRSLSDIIISANLPMIKNVTTSPSSQSEQKKIEERSPLLQSAADQEGWTTGVINNGNRPLELDVNALCLNLNK
jgi:hypothetical protein